jgi:hypothetical protein
MSSSDRLDDPYRLGGATVADGTGNVLPVSLDGISYLIDTSRNTTIQERFRRSSLQLLNTQQNIDKGESGLTAPEVWRRTYQSWHHGAGQKVADREDSDLFRFESSKGVDVWERWQASLLNDTVALDEGREYRSGMAVDGYSVGITAVGFTVTDGVSMIVADPVGMTGTVYATSGKHIFVVGLVGAAVTLRIYEIVTTPSLGVIPHGTDQVITPVGSPSMLVFANFKLLLGTTAGNVYDITNFIDPPSAPTLETPFIKSPLSGFDWIAGCAGKKYVYLLGRQGDKSTVHGATVNDVDKMIDAGVVAELPGGETGTAIYSYLGYIAIGTKSGFRFAAASSDAGGLTYGPLIETPMPVRCFEGQGKFLYYGLSGYDEFDSGIGRADLSSFVADLQPAYASDLMATDQAAHEVVFINTMPDGKILFGTQNGSYKQIDTYVASGTLKGSAWTFNVVDRKTGLYLLVQNTTDSGGTGTFEAYYDRAAVPAPIGNVSSNGSPETRFPLVGVTFNSTAVSFTMTPSPDRTKTPRIYGMELRATYVRGAASEWQVPIILSDSIQLDNGTEQSRDVVTDFEHLLGLVQTGKQFAYVEDGRQWGVYATDFIWSPQERSTVQGWQGVFTIYFREVR